MKKLYFFPPLKINPKNDNVCIFGKYSCDKNIKNKFFLFPREGLIGFFILCSFHKSILEVRKKLFLVFFEISVLWFKISNWNTWIRMDMITYTSGRNRTLAIFAHKRGSGRNRQSKIVMTISPRPPLLWATIVFFCLEKTQH